MEKLRSHVKDTKVTAVKYRKKKPKHLQIIPMR